MIKTGFGNRFLRVLPLVFALPVLADVHYVDVQSTNSVPPYTNWAAAACVIQDAVDAAQAGDEVLVTNGVYATGGREHPLYAVFTNRVAIDKAITVRSVGGPDVTWIVGQGAGGTGTNNGFGAMRCAYVGINAVLSGFTLTNGHTATPSGSNPNHQYGGGAWSEAGGVLTNCTLTGNSAHYAGGGAYGGVLNNCTLVGNYSGQYGGGVYASTLTNCIVIGNSASNTAGGAYGGVLNNCTLVGNYSGQVGGGVYNSTLTNCIVTGNSASNAAGGAYGGVLNNCTLSGNSTLDRGGGAIGSELNYCTLTGNSARYGGGTYASTLNNCTLTGNSAQYGGGAYDSELNNCIVTGNLAPNTAGGAYGGILNNCTLTGNSAHYGGGTYGGTLNNCIVYHNTAFIWANYYGSSFAYSCTTPLPLGTGNMDADPLLASASHLSAQSPCIGRGSTNYTSKVDIEKEAWLNPPCMGADQFVAGTTNRELTVAITAAYTHIAAGFPGLFTAQNTGPVTATVWDFGDGMTISNRAFASHSWAMPGLYPVRLTGYNDGSPGGIVATVLVQVVEQAVYYVNAANPAPVFPYTNWAGAATTIQEAIDAGTQLGRLVRVTNGVYATGGRIVYGQMTNRVVVTEGVEVRSENGPLATIIAGEPAPGTTNNGNGAIRCAYVGANAVLNGFTLTNGHTREVGDIFSERQGGGAWCESRGSLANCTLTGNSASWYGGGAFGGTLNNCIIAGNSAQVGGGTYDGQLTNCTLTGNSAIRSGGGAFGGTLNNCTLTGNSAYVGGGGVYGDTFAPCTLNNCTLTGNSASGAGGGAYRSTLLNCIVYDNTAPYGPNYYSSSIAYSCTTPMPTDGTGNLTNAPAFVNPAAGDYRLALGSPGIDAGTDLSAWLTRDLAGNPRPLDGNGDGVAAFDMGAYEFDWRTAVPPDWLGRYGLATNDYATLAADPDGDGLTTYQEYVAGTCPTNAGAGFQITGLSASAPSNTASVQIATVSNRLYTLQFCTDLGQPNWQAVPGQTDLPGNDTLMTFTDPSAVPPRYYRITVRLP